MTPTSSCPPLRAIACALAFVLVLSVHAAEARNIPDVNVRTHDGRTLRFRSDLIGDRIAVVDFIYTDCTFICTPQGRTFADLSRLLGDRLGRDVVLISVTLAPERDTPAALAKWVADLGGARPGWVLVTGDRRDIGKIIRAMAGVVTPEFHDGAALLVHAPSRTWQPVSGTLPARQLLQRIEAIK